MPRLAPTGSYRRPMTDGDRGGRFDSLSIPTYRRLLIGVTLTFLAMQITMIAPALLALHLPGTNTALGRALLGFCLAITV